MNEWIMLILTTAINAVVTYFINRLLIRSSEKLARAVKNNGRKVNT